jgi:hypothetical protein
MNNKKVILPAILIFLFELAIFITANIRHFEFSIIPLWLILNSCIIAILVLSIIGKLTKPLLIGLSGLNFLPNLVVIIGIGFSGINYLIFYWLAAMALNSYLLIIGIKSKAN